jgi:hypothetical protein
MAPRGKAFQLSLGFGLGLGAYPRVGYMKRTSLWWAPALLADMGLGWGGLLGTSTLINTNFCKAQAVCNKIEY